MVKNCSPKTILKILKFWPYAAPICYVQLGRTLLPFDSPRVLPIVTHKFAYRLNQANWLFVFSSRELHSYVLFFSKWERLLLRPHFFQRSLPCSSKRTDMDETQIFERVPQTFAKSLDAKARIMLQCLLLYLVGPSFSVWRILSDRGGNIAQWILPLKYLETSKTNSNPHRELSLNKNVRNFFWNKWFQQYKQTLKVVSRKNQLTKFPWISYRMAVPTFEDRKHKTFCLQE